MSTMQAAQLITPQGKIFSLPPGMYEAILKILEKWKPAPRVARAEVLALVKETRGKYASGPSLVNALLAERSTEREREMRCDQERAEWFFKKQ
ncbi:MAG: hypothetical protein ISS49_17720 [Anaerolineae bacterium]|nr:hypothetical protein [Anaerolineae bacterium]